MSGGRRDGSTMHGSSHSSVVVYTRRGKGNRRPLALSVVTVNRNYVYAARTHVAFPAKWTWRETQHGYSTCMQEKQYEICHANLLHQQRLKKQDSRRRQARRAKYQRRRRFQEEAKCQIMFFFLIMMGATELWQLTRVSVKCGHGKGVRNGGTG